MPFSVELDQLLGDDVPPMDVKGLVSQAAKKHGVDEDLAQAVAKRESAYDPKAVSPKGAIGPMQLMPDTAKDLGVDPNDPVQNVDAGVRYLKQLLTKYNGDRAKALAAYNAGPTRVDSGKPLPKETEDYVSAIAPNSELDSLLGEVPKISAAAPPASNELDSLLGDVPKIGASAVNPGTGPHVRVTVPGMERLGGMPPGPPQPPNAIRGEGAPPEAPENVRLAYETKYGMPAPASLGTAFKEPAAQIARGVEAIAGAKTGREAAAGATEALQGAVGTISGPENLAPAILAAPVAAPLTMGAGMAASAATKALLKKAGIAPEYAGFAGEVAGLLTVGGGAAKLAGRAYEAAGRPEVKIGGKFDQPKGFRDMSDEELVAHANTIEKEPPKNYQWQKEQIVQEVGRRQAERGMGQGATPAPEAGAVVPSPAPPPPETPPAATPPKIVKGQTFEVDGDTYKVLGIAGQQVTTSKTPAGGKPQLVVLKRDEFEKLIAPPAAPETATPAATAPPAAQETTSQPEAAQAPQATTEEKEPTVSTHENSSTQVNLPPAIAQQVTAAANSIPEEQLAKDGREAEPHITLKYRAGDDPKAIQKLLENEPPITVTLGKASIFAAADKDTARGGAGDSDVLKLDVDSPDLHRINAILAKEYAHPEDYPEYKPHVTLAYLKSGEGAQYDGRELPGITGQQVTLNAITFSGKDGKTVEIPLKGKAATPAAQETAPGVTAAQAPSPTTLEAEPTVTTKPEAQPQSSSTGGTIETSGAVTPGREPAGQKPALQAPDRGVESSHPGQEASVLVPGEDTEYPARYELRELADLKASHHGFTFQQNPDYPYTNDRDYTKPEAQKRVIDQAQKFKPAYLITDNPDATNGPPIVDEEGNALGGNSRVMTVQRVYSLHPDHAEAYRQKLAQQAQHYGIDPGRVADMKQPVLVRVIPDEAALKVQHAITDLNKTGTARLGASEQAIADSRRVSPDTLDFITHRIDQLGEDGSLAKVLASEDGPEIINRLVRDGALTDREAPQYLLEGKITPEGKVRVGRLMIGRFFSDIQLLDNTPQNLKNKLERIVAPLARIEQRPEWDVVNQPIKEALALLEEARTYNLSRLEDVDSQQGMFGQRKYSPEAYRWAYTLKNNSAKTLKQAFQKYAELEYLSRPDTTVDMFAPPPVPQGEGFAEAFDGLRGTKHVAESPAPLAARRGGPPDLSLFGEEPEPLPVPEIAGKPPQGLPNESLFGEDEEARVRAEMKRDREKLLGQQLTAQVKSGMAAKPAKLKPAETADMFAAEDEPEQGGLFARAIPGFYSQLARTIEEKVPAKANPAHILAIVSNPQNGVKADELKWTGLDDWLKKQNRTVTKQEVLDFLKHSQVRVQEVNHGYDPTAAQALQEATAEVGQKKAKQMQIAQEVELAIRKAGAADALVTHWGPNERADLFGEVARYAYGKISGAPQWAWPDRFPAVKAAVPEELIDRYDIATREKMAARTREYNLQQEQQKTPTKYQQYTTPGGKDYRELLLILPPPVDRLDWVEQTTIPTESGRWWKSTNAERFEIYEFRRQANQDVSISDSRRAPEGNFKLYDVASNVDLGRFASLADAQARADEVQAKTSQDSTYTSPHWDEENVLAHVRLDDRTGPNGERLLHVEEVQSDWHQAGKKKGYKGLSPEEQVEKDRLDAKTALLTLDETDWYNRVVNDRQDYGVPSAPFSKTWHELAFRRILRYAAEHDYDAITWTTGEQQAERYDLSKQIDAIKYQPHADGTYSLTVMKGGDSLDIGRDLSRLKPEDIADLVGKEIAEKITKAEGHADEDQSRKDFQKRGRPVETFQFPQEVAPRNRALDTILRDEFGTRWGAETPLQQQEAIRIQNFERAGVPAHRPGGWGIRYASGRTMGTWLSQADAESDLKQQQDMFDEPERKVLSGVDLKVGGEGMKGFYDKILPEYANKYGKKWGARVADLLLPGSKAVDAMMRHDPEGYYWEGEEGPIGPHFETQQAARAYSPRLSTSVHSFPVTSAMRVSVMQGQPLFQRPANPNQLDLFEQQQITTQESLKQPAAPKAPGSFELDPRTVRRLEEPAVPGSFPTMKQIHDYWDGARIYTRSLNGRPAVFVNKPAMDIILRRMGNVGSGQDSSAVLGVTLSGHQWSNIIEEARAAAADPRTGGFDEALLHVAEELSMAVGHPQKFPVLSARRSKAADEENQSAPLPSFVHPRDMERHSRPPLIVVQAGKGTADAILKRTAEEELDHAVQMSLPRGLQGLPHYIVETELGQKAAAGLARYGYPTPNPDSPFYHHDQAIIAAEIGARLMRPGRYQEMGLTRQEARQLAESYIKGLKAKNGDKASGIVDQIYDAIERGETQTLAPRFGGSQSQHQAGTQSSGAVGRRGPPEGTGPAVSGDQGILASRRESAPEIDSSRTPVPRMKRRNESYISDASTRVHASVARLEPLPLAPADARYAEAYLANPSAIELLARVLQPSMPQDYAARQIGALHIAPEDMRLAHRKMDTAHTTYGQRVGTAQLRQVLEQADKAKKSLILVKDFEGREDEARSSGLAEELNHAAQSRAAGGENLGSHLLREREQLFDDPLAHIARAALVVRGYNQEKPGVLAAELGVRLMDPGRYRELGLTYKQARTLAARYLRALRNEYGRQSANELAQRTFSALREKPEPGEGEPGALPGSHGPEGGGGPGGGTGPLISGNLEGRSDALHAIERPAERAEELPEGPTSRFLREETGTSNIGPRLQNLKDWAVQKFGAEDAPKLNYSGLGAVETKYARNLGQTSRAAPGIVPAALRAATPKSQAGVIIATAHPLMRKILAQSHLTLADFYAYGVHDRLRGLENRWRDFAKEAAAISDQDLQQAMNDAHFLGLLKSIEGKKDMADNLAEVCLAVAQAGDWDLLRGTLETLFTDAADQVAHLMTPLEWDRLDVDPNVQEALRLYKDRIERPMRDDHMLNEGVLSDALGETRTYFPLIPVSKELKSGYGRSFPYRKPKNAFNKFATGLGEEYSTAPGDIRPRLMAGIRTNTKAALVQAGTDAGLFKELKPGVDRQTVTWQGVDYKASRPFVVSDARTILQNGKAVHVPAKQVIMPLWFEREMAPILEGAQWDPDGVSPLVNLLMKFTLSGPAEAAFHWANITGAMVANTPFLQNSFLGKAMSLPVIKRLAAIGYTLAVDPTTDEAARELIEMAQAGAVPSRFATETYSRRYAEELGAKKRTFTLAPALFGPEGFDIRARLLMWRLAKQIHPGATPKELNLFVNQLGNYVPQLQGELERRLKSTGFSPFYTAGSTMLRNGINAWTAQGPVPGGTTARILGWKLLTGALGLLTLWVASHKALTGKFPWEDNRSKFLAIPVGGPAGVLNDSVRRSAPGRAFWGDGPETGYIGLQFFNPLVARGARAMGISGMFNTYMRHGSPGQVFEAAQKDVLNSLAHPVAGPPVRAAFVLGAGVEPQLSDFRDRRGSIGPQFFRAIPRLAKPGLQTVGYKGLALLSLNSFYNNLGEATGLLDNPYRKGNLWVRAVTDMAAPGLVGTASNPFAAERALHQQRSGTR